MASLESLLRALELQPQGAGRYRAPNTETGSGVVFGGQLLAQSIVAAGRDHPDKRVKTIHAIFARSGSLDHDVDIAVEVMHSGGSFASSTVTIGQGDRLCMRALVLLSRDEPDVFRHADPAPDVGEPDAAALQEGAEGWEVRIVDAVDLDDPESVGPPEVDVWTRFPDAPDDPAVSQALVAYATDPFLIATSMRPHAGVGQSQAHVTLSTAVNSHTLTFHEPMLANQWVLLSHRSPYAGGGRTYGRADIFQGGALVGSFVQDNMVRHLRAGVASPL